MSKELKPPFKYCLVPCCESTTISTPQKLFFSVPKDKSKRKAWTTAMKRDDRKNPALSCKTTHWCCEDHFSLEEDMEHFWQWKLLKDVKRLTLKEGVLPHLFECQNKGKMPPTERKGALKRKHIALLQDALSDSIVPSTSVEVESSRDLLPATDINVKEDKIVQVAMRKYCRSKACNTTILTTSDVACSPVKILQQQQNLSSHICVCASISQQIIHKIDEDVIDSDSSNEFNDNLESYSSDDESMQEYDFMVYKEHMLKGTVMSIEKNPKLFLGLPIKSYFLIQLITEEAPLKTRNIYIVIKKLKVDDSFARLAIDFGLSVPTISKVFSKSIPILAQLMQDLIFWPKADEIFLHLPIPFRARYAHVVSIIDCLEIEIERPSNPIHQSLTWSKYYDCNTVKFLISCTPDGLVNFVSQGYSGRTSDLMITEDCGYLNHLIPGTAVMADRGFKHIAPLLQQSGCTLVRPPSVSADEICTKDDVRLSKRIASLRIHVERVIGRLREYKMLIPHSCVDHHLVPFLDFSIIIACGLINMQDHLIKNQM